MMNAVMTKKEVKIAIDSEAKTPDRDRNGSVA